MDTTFGTALKAIRLTNKLTQSQMSELLGVSTAYVGQLEQGRAVPSHGLMSLIISKFDVDANILFGKASPENHMNMALCKLLSGLSPSQREAVRELLTMLNNMMDVQKDLLNADE